MYKVDDKIFKTEDDLKEYYFNEVESDLYDLYFDYWLLENYYPRQLLHENFEDVFELWAEETYNNWYDTWVTEE